MKKHPGECRNMVRKICSELGRDLDSPECRPVREHVRNCPDCSNWLESMEKTVELFRRYPTPPHRKIRLK
jgi:predicted anti-sigma-YlaC factor YlaD